MANIVAVPTRRSAVMTQAESLARHAARSSPLSFPEGVTFSYSNLTAFELCPRNYQASYVTKETPYSESEAQKSGKLSHKQLEDYVKAGAAVPIGLLGIRKMIDLLCDGALRVMAERRIGLTWDLRPCEFFDEEVAYRGVIDLTVLRPKYGIIIDYKTGEPRDDFLQLKLNALQFMHEYPQYDTVHLIYMYTHHKMRRMEFKRSEIPALLAEIVPRVERLRLARQKNLYPTRESWKCKFCDLTKCQFNKRR